MDFIALLLIHGKIDFEVIKVSFMLWFAPFTFKSMDLNKALLW